MARKKVRIVPGKPRNDVYVGMLALMAFSMLLGIGVLLLEWSEYDFTTEAKGGPTITLPKDTLRPSGSRVSNSDNN